MQCPRCGLQNLPDITACARCGLAVWPAPPPGAPRGDPPAGAVQGPAHATPGRYGQPAPGGQGYGAPEDQPSYGAPSGQPSYGAPSGQPSYGQPSYGAPSGQPSYGAPGTSSPYGQPSYGAPGTSSSYGQPPYGQPPQPRYPPAGSPYSTGPVAPYGATALLPVTRREDAAGSADRNGTLARLLLLLGVLACAGYAVWALTARRGIFADFADNRSVSLSDARSSDRLDTVFLVVAGAIAVIALVFWLVRLLNGQARSGLLTVAGLVISGLGLICVVVGLVLSGLVGSNGSRVDEGQKAVTSTIVTGSGFIALAIGLLIGCLVIVRSKRATTPDTSPDGVAGSSADW